MGKVEGSGMGILTNEEILKEIGRGTISIDPSIDIRWVRGRLTSDWATSFGYLRNYGMPSRWTNNSLSKTSPSGSIGEESFTLMPGETVLGITLERIKLPPNICGWLEGRSRFARIGLVIHMTASFVQPGIDNRQVLEIGNLAPFPLVLKPGVRICQIILERTEGEASYRGSFMDQDRL